MRRHQGPHSRYMAQNHRFGHQSQESSRMPKPSACVPLSLAHDPVSLADAIRCAGEKGQGKEVSVLALRLNFRLMAGNIGLSDRPPHASRLRNLWLWSPRRVARKLEGAGGSAHASTADSAPQNCLSYNAYDRAPFPSRTPRLTQGPGVALTPVRNSRTQRGSRNVHAYK